MQYQLIATKIIILNDCLLRVSWRLRVIAKP